MEMAGIEESIKQSAFQSEQIKASVNIIYTAHWLNAKMTATLRPFNLTQEQFNVLRILRGSHPRSMCQKDILSRMVAPSSNLTLLMKKLKDKDLVTVTQSDKDRREYVINIHKNGLALLKKLDTVLEKRATELEKLSASEAFHLNALLDKLRS